MFGDCTHNEVDLYESDSADDASRRARTFSVLEWASDLHVQHPASTRQLIRGLSAIPPRCANGRQGQSNERIGIPTSECAHHCQVVSNARIKLFHFFNMLTFYHRLVLPLVIRQTVNITNSGFNFTETTDLSTFGFLYGTFPAAPGVFVVATRYNTDVDLVSLTHY